MYKSKIKWLCVSFPHISSNASNLYVNETGLYSQSNKSLVDQVGGSEPRYSMRL